MPLYERIKHHVLDSIEQGTFKAGDKLPSENELAAELGASRLTVHRALRELTTSGVVQRVHGVGSFVAEPRAAATLIRIHNIADEIRERGQSLEIRVIELARVSAPASVAREMGITPGEPLFRSLIVYCADASPVQIEDRAVLPSFAPDFLHQDFARGSTTDYLQAIAQPTEASNEMRAVLPSEAEAALLDIPPSDPCLLIRRTTWVQGVVTTITRFLHPSSRYSIVSRVSLTGDDNRG
ncbi:UTRA domain-containing protein [Methylobacterium terricola]|uniref:UTRA domain-containing protein n=1 Tax=Methylobacterium terricola TaxID=2583531 RepID=UPI00197B4DA8|nr:UTRA domain-containing protein [Methylobacterium terricola]